MANRCAFPLCTRFCPEGKSYCISHRIYSDSPVVKEEKKTPIPKKSEKRIINDKEYKKILADLKKISDRCEIKSPVCTGKMQGGHHVQKTTPKNRTVKNNVKRCCNACNLYIENFPDWSVEHGFSVSKFAKQIPEKTYTETKN